MFDVFYSFYNKQLGNNLFYNGRYDGTPVPPPPDEITNDAGEYIIDDTGEILTT